MDDEFKSIDEPPEELPAGMTPADFEADEASSSVPTPEPDLSGPGPGPGPGGSWESPGMEPEPGGMGMEPGLGEVAPGAEPGGELGAGAGEPGAGEEKPSAQDRLKSLTSTPKGIAILVGGVVGVLVVFGAVAFIVMGIFSRSSAPPVTVTGVEGTSTTASGTAGSTTGTNTAGGGSSEGLPEAFEVFENRDPFTALIVKTTDDGTTAEVSSVSGTTGSTTSGATTSEGGTTGGTTGGGSSGGGSTSTNSLTLKSISYDDGHWTAVLVYGGKNYSVHSGDTVDSSPWKVISISASSVTVQYGDDSTMQTTLTLT